MTRDELQRMRNWADEKIATGAEPPWTWFQYMKLREVMDQILAGTDAVRTESSPQLGSRSESGPRLAVSNTQPDNARPHQLVVAAQLPT